jgi:TPR repeat protein
LAEGKPSDELTAAQAGLAASYLPDRGEDDYRKPRRQRVRRDLAAYLLRVQHQDPQAADALGWQLQAVPAAWCSLVLPTRTPADFDRQLDTANRRGQELAQALGVTFTPPVSARKHRLLLGARQAAADQFCPAQARTPGKPVSAPVALPARFPDGNGEVDILITALPEYYAPNSLGAGTPTIGAQDLRQAYVDTKSAEILYQWASVWGVAAFAMMPQEGDGISDAILSKDTDRGNPSAMLEHGRARERAGDFSAAEHLYRRAADLGDTKALARLAEVRWKVGDRREAEELLRQVVDRGDHSGLYGLVWICEGRGGDLAAAEAVALRAVGRGDPIVFAALAKLREIAGDRAGAEAYDRQYSSHSRPPARLHEQSGTDAEDVRRRIDRGDPDAIQHLAVLVNKSGDRTGASQIFMFGLTESGEAAAALDFGP